MRCGMSVFMMPSAAKRCLLWVKSSKMWHEILIKRNFCDHVPRVLSCKHTNSRLCSGSMLAHYLHPRDNVHCIRHSSCHNAESKPPKVIKQDPKIDMSKYPAANIRNFGIVAHVDHGKSTLSDRLLEITGTISKDAKNEQVLDKLPVERERGITVKAQTVSLFYEHKGTSYLLNLIDTPGHVDFSYEVVRSLAACQGVVLLVDANQGIQAQTVAHFNLAFCSDLTIIPVMNKVDLKNAKPENVATQMENVFGVDKSEILKVSAKFGTGVEDLLTAIVERIKPPSGDLEKPFRACLFDFWFDRYRGVISLVALVDGRIAVGDQVASCATGLSYEVREIGILHPEETPVSELQAGQVGYLVLNMRNVEEAKLGDTLYLMDSTVEPLFKIEPAKSMVFAGIYPMDQSQNAALRSAIEKLLLNDPSVTVDLENSPALGQGWRLGFLGLLHMEVFCQRLDQEFDAQVVVTAPSVTYKAKLIGEKNIKTHGEVMIINNPLKFPDRNIVSEYLEPVVLGTIITPDTYLGAVMSLSLSRRGVQKSSENIDNSNIMLQFKFPLSEIIVDFYDELKSVTSGYASFDYEDFGFETTDLSKLSILINGNVVEELTTIVHTGCARRIGRTMCLRLKESIPPQQFEIAIQASIRGKVIARETIKAYRKDVLAKLHAADPSRKMKLLKRQAEGKKRMRMIGNVQIPRDAFIKVLKR